MLFNGDNEVAIIVKHYYLLAPFVLARLAVPAHAEAPGAWTQVGVLTCRLQPEQWLHHRRPPIDGMQ